MELTYRQEGDYLLPNVMLPENPKVGKYGMLRRDFLKNHRDPIYTGMFLNGKLKTHLEEIDRQATEMMEHLTMEMAKAEGVSESLKASNQMLWVARMNSIRERAEEMVLNDLIYA